MRTLIVVVCLALAAPATAADPVYDDQALTDALAAPTAVAVGRRIDRAAAAGDTGTLLESIDAAARLLQPARTMLTFHALLGIAAAPPSAAAMPVLEHHAAHPSVVRRWFDGEGQPVAVDAYDTGAAARFALRSWHRQQARVQARAELAAGTFPGAVTKSTQHDPVAVAGHADALADAPIDELRAARAGVAAALAAGEPVDPLALVIIERLHDAELAALLLVRGDGAFVVRALGALTAAFAPEQAFALLEPAAARPDIASAVVARIGDAANSVPAARAWLLDRLGDPALGASAAAALARIADSAVIMDLARVLNDGASPRAQARAALALKLADTAGARTVLMRFVEEGSEPDALRRVIERWLR